MANKYRSLYSAELDRPYSSATNILNYSGVMERSPNFVTGESKITSKNWFENNRASLDDSEEISKRLTQLRLSLGLSESKANGKLFKENSPNKSKFTDYQTVSRDNQSVNEFSKYISNISLNAPAQKDYSRPFGTTFGNPPTSNLHADLESSPTKDYYSQNLADKSYNDILKELSTTNKKNTNDDLLLSDRSPNSKYETSRVEALKTTGLRSNVDEVLSTQDNKDRFEKLALHFQRENEILRKRLEEEQAFHKKQIEILGARMEEYKRSMTFDKQSEELLKENTIFYKSQIEELEKMITELNAQLEETRHNEKSARDHLESIVEEFRIKEEGYKNQIKVLQQELELRRNYALHRVGMENLDPAITKDQYVRQLETDIKFLKSHLEDMIEKKSQADIKIESLERDLKNVTQKVTKELENKYKQELKEKKFLIDSLKRENQAISLVSKGGVDAVKKYLEPERRLSTKSPHKQKSGSKSKNKGDKSKKLDDVVVNLQIKINELENQNFLLAEKNTYLEDQLRNLLNKADAKILSQAFSHPNEIFERRCQTLSESVVFWKEKSAKLASEFAKALQELRNENENTKRTLIEEVSQFELEIFDCVKKIKKNYQKENAKILEIIEELEEKHHQNQARLAEARTVNPKVDMSLEFRRKKKF